MPIQATPVSQCLDKKMQIVGFDIPDLLLIFGSLSALNFLFGQTNYKIALVWVPTVLLATILRIGKRGKPENFLMHLFRYFFSQKHLYAFYEDTK